MEKVIALLPWDITVRRARTRKQAHELLERNDADEAIRALTETEAYYAVKELGVDGALPFLAVLEPQQITALFDLDVWHEDRADLPDLLLWLSAFKEASVVQLQRAVRAMDPELFALLLKRRLLITPLVREDDEEASTLPDWAVDPPEDIQPLVETPDKRFIIAARVYDEESSESEAVDEEERKAILDLVDALYKDEDFDFIAGALRSAEADLSSGLEDTALHFRTGRLEDLGFPPIDRALELYAPLDPREIVGPRPAQPPPPTDFMLPAIHAQQLSHGLFQEVLRTIESPETVRRLEGELVALTNAALVADRVEPGDLERIREVLDRARAYLELALAFETDPVQRIDIARTRLETQPIRNLFRAGFGITIDLQRRAARIKKVKAFSAGDGRELDLIPEPYERAMLEALLGPRPRFARVLEDPARSDEVRPFEKIEDVDLVKKALDDLEALAMYADAHQLARRNAELSGALDPPEKMERDIDMLLTTMAASSMLGRGFHLGPLDAVDLAELTKKLEHGRFPTALIDHAIREAGLGPEVDGSKRAIERRIRRGLGVLQEALSPLVGASEIDPRYVGVVVRRVG
jgi:hypothetical protein